MSHEYVSNRPVCHLFCPRLLSAWLAESRDSIMTALNASPFRVIWFFDCWTQQVLEVIARHKLKVS
jgi:hypothetical protein